MTDFDAAAPSADASSSASVLTKTQLILAAFDGNKTRLGLAVADLVFGDMVEPPRVRRVAVDNARRALGRWCP